MCKGAEHPPFLLGLKSQVVHALTPEDSIGSNRLSDV